MTSIEERHARADDTQKENGILSFTAESHF